MIIYCDIDGTLSNDEHRRKYSQTCQWDVYHMLAECDKPYMDVLELLYNWAVENHTIILLTGRHEKYRERTVAWLRKYGVPFDYLRMRPDEDTICPTAALKYGWIQGDEDWEGAIIVIENNPEQARALAEQGLTVWQIRRGK